MTDQQPNNTSDELQHGLDTTANLAGEAVKRGLPSRPKRSSPSSDGGFPAAAPSDINPSQGQPNDFGQPLGSTPENIPNQPGGGHKGQGGASGQSGTHSSPAASGGKEAGSPGSGNENIQNYNPRMDFPSGGMEGTGAGAGNAAGGTAGGAAAESAGNMAGAAAGTGTGTGAGAGVAAGAAGAGAGAAASTAAGAAAGGGASGGVAAGATVGSAAGPVGTIVGALAGALAVPVIKLILMAVATITILSSFFMMQPSFLYDNSRAVNDRELLEETYNTYYSNIQDEYRNDVLRSMSKAKNNGYTVFREQYSGGSSGFYNAPASYPHIRMGDADQEKLSDVLSDSFYDSYEFTYEVTYLRDVESYVDSASSNINLCLCLIDTQKKNWFDFLFEEFANGVTGGLYGHLTDWIGRKWDGFWNDFIVYDLYSISVGSVHTRTEVSYTVDGEEIVRHIAVITIDYKYDFKDKGVSFYVNKLGADQNQLDRAAEMANYLADLFDSASDSYLGFWVESGYYTDAIQGGTVGSNITAALNTLKDEIAGMEYDPDGAQIFPLQGYTNPNMSSHYGPRDFASDPWHTGVDFAAPTGTPILSACDGIVLFKAQMPNGFGNYIVVYHGDYNGESVATMYGHMSAFGNYKAGDHVSAGDVIGYVGSTGLSTGPHLHFQLHIGNTVQNPVEFFEFLSYLRP